MRHTIRSNYPHLSPLLCDSCQKEIGKVSEFDLQGSYFYCDECVEKESRIEPWERVVEPREREILRLACGCHVVDTGSGSASVFACREHGRPGAKPDVEEVIAKARHLQLVGQK